MENHRINRIVGKSTVTIEDAELNLSRLSTEEKYRPCQDYIPPEGP